jgi:hypothetical protein
MSREPSHTESELVKIVRSIDVRAPDELHDKIQALVAEHASKRRGSPWTRALGGSRTAGFRLGGALAALAVVVLVLVLAVAGTGTPELTLRQTQALTLSAATSAAPAKSASHPKQLAANVDGVAFPYWEDRFGWRSSGARIDHVGGRAVTTVFYTNASGRRVGYSIVAGTPPPAVSGGTIAWSDGTPYRMMRANGAQLVTWRRDGHLCVVSGRGMSSATLLRLASWSDGGVAA